MVFTLCYKTDKIMNEEDIIKIVKKLADNTLVAIYDDNACYYKVGNKTIFYKKLKDKLKKLFDENDLSK